MNYEVKDVGGMDSEFIGITLVIKTSLMVKVWIEISMTLLIKFEDRNFNLAVQDEKKHSFIVPSLIKINMHTQVIFYILLFKNYFYK